VSGRYSGRFYDDFPGTAGLLLVVLGFFVLEVVLQGKISEDPHHDFTDHISRPVEAVWVLGSVSNLSVIHDREFWRLLAACFLHFGWVHLLMNCWVLVDLGRTCEPMLGLHRFIATYVLCGLSGSLASVGWQTLRGSAAHSAGASGALFGFIGLLLAFSLRHRDRLLREQIVRWLVYMGVFSVVFIGWIDHAGHLGGFAAGFVLGWFVPRYISSDAARRWRIPSWTAMAAAAAALGFSVWSMFRTLIERHGGF
jgi:rhomboid protease GluP